MEMLTRKKKLLLDRNLSRLLANLTFVGSLNFFCSAATVITHDVKRLWPCAIRLLIDFQGASRPDVSVDLSSGF